MSAPPRYLLFAGSDYYPKGGWNDFRGAFDSVELAKADIVPRAHDGSWPDSVEWWQIVDSTTREVVLQYRDGEETTGEEP